MHLSLSSIVLLLSAVNVVTSQYTFKYWASAHCGGSGLQCGNIPEFDCCNEPLSPSSFLTIKATSSGPTGVVIFTEVSAGGGCGNCQFTGSINSCFDNTAPFNTAYIAGVSSVCANTVPRDLTLEAHGNITMSELSPKQPVSEAGRAAPPQCRTRHQVDTATVAGLDYDITGPEREIIISGMLPMSTEDFEKKWASVKK